MCLHFEIVIFWQKDFGAKAAHKMLVKLTPGGSMGPKYVLQLKFAKTQQPLKPEKNKHRFGILIILGIF